MNVLSRTQNNSNNSYIVLGLGLDSCVSPSQSEDHVVRENTTLCIFLFGWENLHLFFSNRKSKSSIPRKISPFSIFHKVNALYQATKKGLHWRWKDFNLYYIFILSFKSSQRVQDLICVIEYRLLGHVLFNHVFNGH